MTLLGTWLKDLWKEAWARSRDIREQRKRRARALKFIVYFNGIGRLIYPKGYGRLLFEETYGLSLVLRHFPFGHVS
jgi:hypothetical protein